LQAVEKQEDTSGQAMMSPESISEEDVLRAQVYRLLATYLSKAPDQTELDAGAALIGDNSDFGVAISNFAKVAGHCDPDTADTEFHDLFIGVTRGELLPYGSYYQTGFLNEKPLANLRAFMANKGIVRAAGLKEPEDHIASVLEIMAGLIDGAYGPSLSLAEQKIFFEKHVDSWATHFFKDLEGAKYSLLYAPLGTVGQLFMQIEQEAFVMIK